MYIVYFPVREKSSLRMVKKLLLKNKRICFIGSGNMAEALLSGFIRAGAVSKKNIAACDIRKERTLYLSRKYGIRTSPDNVKPALSADIVIIAVKPAQVSGVLGQLSGKLRKTQLVITIAAGIRTKLFEKYLPGIPVIRVMPNTCALLGEGMIVLCRGRYAGRSDEKAAVKLFGSAGAVLVQPERMFDAVTAVSGSGPAYVFYLAESMIEAAVRMGFSRPSAELLVIQTIFGAGRMLKNSPDSPGILRMKVTSPGGTTEKAIGYLRRKGFPGILSQAIKLAGKRAFELSEMGAK